MQPPRSFASLRMTRGNAQSDRWGAQGDGWGAQGDGWGAQSDRWGALDDKWSVRDDVFSFVILRMFFSCHSDGISRGISFLSFFIIMQPFFRIYMPKILKKFTKHFLYVDADMICLGSLKPFLEMDFKNTPVAVVSDVPEAVKIRTAFLKLKNGKYFNSGMMYINVEEWEKQKITERCFEYTGKDPKMFMGHDQDVLNLVLDGNFVLLPNKFNFLGGMGSRGPKDTIFYHFFGRTKPWEICLNEFDELWWQANDISLWRHERIKYPPLQPKYYHDYKYAGKYYSKKKEYLKAWKCYLIYSYLKIRYKL